MSTPIMAKQDNLLSRLRDPTQFFPEGIDIRVVQQILGHSQLRMTERYTHVTQKLTQDAANRMGKALWG